MDSRLPKLEKFMKYHIYFNDIIYILIKLSYLFTFEFIHLPLDFHESSFVKKRKAKRAEESGPDSGPRRHSRRPMRAHIEISEFNISSIFFNLCLVYFTEASSSNGYCNELKLRNCHASMLPRVKLYI